MRSASTPHNVKVLKWHSTWHKQEKDNLSWSIGIPTSNVCQKKSLNSSRNASLDGCSKTHSNIPISIRNALDRQVSHQTIFGHSKISKSCRLRIKRICATPTQLACFLFHKARLCDFTFQAAQRAYLPSKDTPLTTSTCGQHA